MSLSGRTISRALKGNSKGNQTKGTDKGPSCQKSELKEFGRNANPYKLHGYGFNRYMNYCRHVDSLNK